MPADHAASTARGAEARGPGAPRARRDQAVALVRAAVVTAVVAVVAEVGAAVVVVVRELRGSVEGLVRHWARRSGRTWLVRFLGPGGVGPQLLTRMEETQGKMSIPRSANGVVEQ